MAIDPNNPVAETNPALGEVPLISNQVQREIDKRQFDRIPSTVSFTPFANPRSGPPQIPLGIMVADPNEDAREKMSDYPASFISASSSTSPEGSAGRFTLSGPLADWWATGYFAKEWNNRSTLTNAPSYRELYNLSKAEASKYLQPFIDELDSVGYPVRQDRFDSTEDFVDAVANTYSTQKALEDRTGLFEKWYSVPVGIFNLATTAVLDPVNYVEFGLGTAIKSAIVKSTVSGTARSAVANLLMKSSYTRNPLKWVTKNVAIPTLKLTDNLVSITPGATQSIHRSAFNSILINSTQAAIQASAVSNEFQEQGWDYDPNNIFLETGLAAIFTGGLSYGINGLMAGKRAWNQKVAGKVELADRVADTTSEMMGTNPLPKYALPENGGPDDVLNINTRASLAEEIAYQLNYLLKDPFYRHKEALDQKWWDAHVDSGVDQSLFLGWMRNNKPTKAEIDNFIDTVSILDQRAKALKMGKAIDAKIENSWSDFIENELEVAGVAVRLGTEKDKIKNMAWFMANIKEMLERGDVPKISETLADGTVVTKVDQNELNSQVLAIAALVSSRAGSLGMSADDYIFRTFKDFVMDPRDSELIDKVLFSMAGTGMHGGWNKIEKIDFKNIGSGEGTSWEGWGFYVTFGPKSVAEGYRNVASQRIIETGGTPFQRDVNGTISYKPGSISKVDVKVDTTTEVLTWEKTFNDHSVDIQNGFIEALTEILNRNLTIANQIEFGSKSFKDQLLYTQPSSTRKYLSRYDVQKIVEHSGLGERLTGETMYNYLAKLYNYWNDINKLKSDKFFRGHFELAVEMNRGFEQIVYRINDKKYVSQVLDDLDITLNDIAWNGRANLDGRNAVQFKLKSFPFDNFKFISDYTSQELKPVSELLKSKGIYGMQYFGDEKKGPYRNMVVWDESKLEVVDVMYNKDTAGKAKAAVGFQNGRAIIYGFQNATDIVSLSHELGHIFRRELSKDQLARLSTWAGMDPDDVNWTVEAEEKFARAFEMYLATRKFAGYKHKGLEQVFSNYRRWMRDVYGSVDEIAKLGNIDAKINPKLRKTFDELLKPRFQPKVRGIETALIGPERRTGIVNLTITDPADRLAIQLARSTDFAERTVLLQKLMDTTGMTEAETLYWSANLWHNVKKQIRSAKKELKKGARALQPGDPVKRTIKEYNTKLTVPGSEPKLVRMASQILARFDAAGVDFFVNNVHKQFMDIAKKMNLKVSKELLDKTWVYMGTAGQLYGEKNPFTDEAARNQFLDAALGKLTSTDPKADFATLRTAGEKIRTDANVIPDIIGPVEIKVHKTPTIDINVDAIKIPDPTDKQLEKFASKYMNMKDPTSIFSRAMEEVTQARDERIALDQSGDLEAIKQNRIRLRRALQNLRKVHSKYVPSIAGVSPAPVKLDIELGVVEANPGSVLSAGDTSDIIANASRQGIFGEGKENWLVYAKNQSLRTLRKWGNLFDQGSLATVGSQIPIIARFSHLISSHNLYTDSFGFSKMVGPGFEQRKRRVVSKISKIIVDLNNTTKHLDDPSRELVMRHAMAKVNNVAMASLSDPNLTRTIDSVANTLSVLFKEYEQRGLASGYFRGTLDAYSGTFVIRPDRRSLTGLSEAFYKYFFKKFTQPDSALHRKTVFEIPQFYTFNTVTGLYDPTGFTAKYGKVPEKFSDLDAADKALYLAALSDTAADSSGIYNRGLRREALLAARNKLGMVETKMDTDLALVKADTTMSRSLEVDVWFDPEVAQFVDWRIGEGLSQYASSTAYRISEKEGTNLFVQQLLGVSRRDIDIKNLASAVENFLLSDTKLNDFERGKIQESFKYLTNQINALRESFVSDVTRKQGITDDIVDIASSVARVPVSARSALAGTVTELPMLLVSVLSKDGPRGLARIVKDVLSGATKDQLKGIMAGYLWMRNHMPHTLQSAVNATHVNRNWLEKTFVNPARVVSGSKGAMDKTKAVAAFLHHASSGIAGEDLLQGFISGISVHAASVRVIRNWDRIKKLSEAMQKHNWAAEAEPEKVFRKMAYDAGFGEDGTFAATLNQSGLLDPKTIRELEEIDRSVGGRLLDKDNGALDYGILEDALIKNQKYRETVERVIAHKETELTKHVTVPGVQDVNIPAGGLDPATKLKNMFTSFARSWFNNIMLNHVANEKLTYALFLVSVGLVGEMLYNISLRTMYHNEPLEDILEDLEEDPASAVMLAIGRSNVFGTSNILPMFVFDQITGKSNASTQASSLYPIAQSTALIRSIANMTKAAFSDDKEITEKDANRIESFIPAANAWWMKSVGEVTGWGGPAQWFAGKQTQELQPAN